MAGRKRIPKINVGEYPYANLMPASRNEILLAGKAKEQWIKIVIGSAVVAVILTGGSFGWQLVQANNLAAVEKSQASVEAKIKEFAAVDSTMTIRDGRLSDIERAGANAINWQKLATEISSNLPQGSSLSSFNALTGGTKEGEPSTAIVVTISSAQPIDYSNVLESFSVMDGVTDGSVVIGDLASSNSNAEVAYEYSVAFSMDNTFLLSFMADGETAEVAEVIEEELSTDGFVSLGEDEVLEVPAGEDPSASVTNENGEASAANEQNASEGN